MRIKYFCPIWGSTDMEYAAFFEKAKNAGYDGVEMSLPMDDAEKKEILVLLKEYNLELIAQHWETLTADFELHKKEYKARMINLASAKPLLVNTQTGKDFFTFEQNAELIDIAKKVSQEYAVKIIHETHRGKFSFAAHIVSQFLTKIPDLKLTLDISHWCNVAETLLEDQTEAVDLAIERTEHIHSRVGFSEGPQIPDPRAPEWKEVLETHTNWWQKVIDKRRAEGRTEFTIAPEFGPYPYMTQLPFKNEPITDQWAVNVFMMEHLKKTLK